MRLVPFFLTFLLPLTAQAEAPRVITSIAPLAGITAAVMEGVGIPAVLVKGNASPHTYQLSPSDATALSQAQLVVWVGSGLENFLERPLATLADKAVILELLETDGLETFPVRAGGIWEPEEHEDGPAHGTVDPHLWLAPNNAAKIAALIGEKLAALDSVHADTYHTNVRRFTERLLVLDRDLTTRLAPVKTRPFIVFHDAYQYFEHHYGLNGAGTITLSPEEQPSAARVAALRTRIESGKIACIYAEPQFSPALLTTLTEGTKAETGILNPDASDLPVDAALYPAYLTRLAEDFLACHPAP